MLNDVKCRRAVCPEGTRQIKLSDERGLFLLVNDRGGKYWRVNYRIGGKQKTLALGVYPEIGLKEARAKRDKARAVLREGRDPAVGMRRGGIRFEQVAAEWVKLRRGELAASTVRLIEMRLKNDIDPVIGGIAVGQVRAADILAMLLRICDRGAVETAHRCRAIVGQVLRYAIVTGRAEHDPTPALKGAIRRPDSKHMATMLKPADIGDMLRRIEGYQGTMVARAALLLNLLTFLRPGELRQAEWVEFDLDAALWMVPAGRMKMKNRGDHIVPLARQSVDMLRELHRATGYGSLVFPGRLNPADPIAYNTLNHALRRMGIDKNKQVAHGFRAMARTLLAERGWRAEIIERQLAHAERSRVVAAYNRAEFLGERREMMQYWADYLDEMKIKL